MAWNTFIHVDSGYYFVRKIEVLKDSSILAWIHFGNHGSLLYNLSPDGKIKWAFNRPFFYIYEVNQIKNNNLILSGLLYKPKPGWDPDFVLSRMCITELLPDGKPIWSKSVDTLLDYIYSTQVMDNSDYLSLVIGSQGNEQSSSVKFAVFDSTGFMKELRYMGDTSQPEIPRKLIKLDKDTFIAAIDINDKHGFQEKIKLVKFSPYTGIIKTRIFEKKYDFFQYGDIIKQKDGNILMGYTIYDVFNRYKSYALKMDRNLNILNVSPDNGKYNTACNKTIPPSDTLMFVKPFIYQADTVWHKDTFLSVRVTAKNDSWNMYPNPFSSTLNLPVPCAGCSFELIDLWGRSVCKGLLQGNSINTQSLHRGFYILKLYDVKGRMIHIQKMIKE